MLIRGQNVVEKEKPLIALHIVWMFRNNSSSSSSAAAATDYEPLQACYIFMGVRLSRSNLCFFCWLECIHMLILKCVYHSFLINVLSTCIYNPP
jgi:hypothetical protein